MIKGEVVVGFADEKERKRACVCSDDVKNARKAETLVDDVAVVWKKSSEAEAQGCGCCCCWRWIRKRKLRLLRSFGREFRELIVRRVENDKTDLICLSSGASESRLQKRRRRVASREGKFLVASSCLQFNSTSEPCALGLAFAKS